MGDGAHQLSKAEGECARWHPQERRKKKMAPAGLAKQQENS